MRPDACGICLLKQTASGAQSVTSPSKIEGFREFEADLSALLSPKIYAESSNRKERGMYITGGVRFNADAVGAFKILQTHRRNWIVYAGSGEYNTIRMPFCRESD